MSDIITDNVTNHKLDLLPTTPHAEKKNGSGKTLHQLFKDEGVSSSEAPTLSFWSRIIPAWLKGSDEAAAISKTSHSESSPLPISSIPVIEAPDSIPAEIANFRPPLAKKSRSSNEKLPPSQVMEGLSQMSDKTREEIMRIILKAQMELEKETANVAEGTFTKYQAAHKLREKILQEIKDALAKDEQVAGYFKNGQQIAFAASVLCGLAAAIVTGLPAIAGLGYGIGWGITMLGTYGPVAAGAVAAVTTGSKSYFQGRLNEDKAKHEEFKHLDRYTSDRTDDARERLMAIAESNNEFEERRIKREKQSDKMKKRVSDNINIK